MPLPRAAIPALVALLGVLLVRWVVARWGRTRPELGWGIARPWRETGLVVCGALLASAPVLAIAPHLLSPSSLLPSDAIGHAGVAHAIARHGLPHGWVDAYYGGFPFGLHYQSVPLLLLAGLMRLGIDPVVAANALGLLGILAVPVVYAGGASRAGASAAAALSGALVLSWVAPSMAFIGGPGVYTDQGLLSQAVAMPVLLGAAGAVVLEPSGDQPRVRWALLLGALSIACHVQATAALITATLPVCLLLCGPGVRRRWLEAAGGALVLGVALYGPGLSRFRVPFSWVAVPPWKIVGFGPRVFAERLADGLWLDANRAPVMTVAAAAACCLCLLLPSRVGVAALAFFGTVCGLSALGEPLPKVVPLAQKLVEVYSPVRLMAFLPLAVAIAVTVSSHELLAHLRQVGADLGWSACRSRRAVMGVIAFAVAGLTGGALPERVDWAKQRARVERDWSGSQQCGPVTPVGYDAKLIASWIRDLRGARLAVDQASFPTSCPGLRGLDARAPVPLGTHVGGPGTQVGILSAAFDAIRPDREGSALRAEAMGVRWVLLARREPLLLDGWRIRRQAGDVVLLERVSGGDEVGIGCITSEWSGPDRALRDALWTELRQPKSFLDTPLELTLLQEAPGAFAKATLSVGPCVEDAARVEQVPREPGAYQARISSPQPVDVVVRATYVPEWRMTVDGQSVPHRKVAPGFVAVRVPSGAHELVAVVSLPHGYVWGILLATVVLLGIAYGDLLRDRWRRRDARGRLEA
ncbi:MAG: hypothetical protein HS104_08850 [Polyangiaceae bacterium]|nr:hypothetical protein [Polyangiaceae bacterium]